MVWDGMICSYVTLPGKSSHQERKTNQDNLVVIPQLGGKDHLAVFGVFDGHGEHGEHASVSGKQMLWSTLGALMSRFHFAALLSTSFGNGNHSSRRV